MARKKKLVLTYFPFFVVIAGIMGIIALITMVPQPGSFLQGSVSVGSGKRFASLVGPSPTPTSTPTPTPTPKPLVPPILPGERALKVPVLLYHYISLNPNKTDIARNGLSTAPDVFDQQLATLKTNGFTTVTFDELAAAFDGKMTLPAKPVILTVDDGYADFYYNAYPILQKYQMKAIAFIPTGLMGGGMYMTWAQIEELARSPYVIFGAHSIHHYFLSKIAPSVMVSEIVDSKRILEQHVGYTVNWFCYPYGGFNDAVVDAVKKAGYIGAITTLPGAWQYRSRFYYIPRYRAGNLLGANLLKLVN